MKWGKSKKVPPRPPEKEGLKQVKQPRGPASQKKEKGDNAGHSGGDEGLGITGERRSPCGKLEGSPAP